MNKNKSKSLNREINFNSVRLSNLLSEATIFAIYHGIPLELFIELVKQSYIENETFLKRESNQIDTNPVPVAPDPAHMGPAEVIRPKTDKEPDPT